MKVFQTGEIAIMNRLTPQDITVLVGSNLVCYPALCVGVAETANVVPEIPIRIYDCFMQGNHIEALELQRALNPLAI